MNYVVVVVGGTAFIAALYWAFVGRHKYHGPVRAHNDWYKPEEHVAKKAPAGPAAPPLLFCITGEAAVPPAAEDPK